MRDHPETELLAALRRIVFWAAVALIVWAIFVAVALAQEPATVTADPLVVEQLRESGLKIQNLALQSQIEELKAQLLANQEACQQSVDPKRYDLDVGRGLFIRREIK